MLRVAVRLLSPVLAVLLAIDWLLAPSALNTDTATRLEVTAEYVKLRRARPYAALATRDGQVTQVPCDKTARLCERLEVESPKALTVWIVEPGLFHGTWLVAANEGAVPLVTIELQNRIYSGARAFSTLATVALAAFSLFVWRRRWWPIFGRRMRA